MPMKGESYTSANKGARGREEMNNEWVHSKYFGYICSRIYLGSDGIPIDLIKSYSLDWKKDSLVSNMKLR